MNHKLDRRVSCFITVWLLLILIPSEVRIAYSSAHSAGLGSGWTALVSAASDGIHGDKGSYFPEISADGRYVAFYSSATNLVAEDTNGYTDVFVHDRESSEVSRVSIASDGTQGNKGSTHPAISAEGRYVAFYSSATNLVAGDTNVYLDIFVYDRESGETSRVSIASNGMQGNGNSYSPSISSNGRYVTFESYASNLVTGDTNGVRDIFLHDRESGETNRISITTDGMQGNSSSYNSAISADGLYVAFESDASNLVTGDTNGVSDIFVHNRESGETSRISVDSNGIQGNDLSSYPGISATGRYVAFGSFATNLVTGDTNGTWDVFVHDRESGETSLVSLNSNGTQGNDRSIYPAISSSGRYVAFSSFAANLVLGDTNEKFDIFMHDRESGETSLVSIASDGTQGNDHSIYSAISDGGRYVAFGSDSNNLVMGDMNGFSDIFVHGFNHKAYLPLAVNKTWRLIISLGQDSIEEGLYLDEGEDVDTEVLQIGSSFYLEARGTGNGQALPSSDGNLIPDNYMQFDVDDSVVFASPPGTQLVIEVEYLDVGSDSFSIQYDAHSGGPFGDGRFRNTSDVIKSNSGEIRRAIFLIDDVYFGNRDNGADFRIDDHGNGAEVILSVMVHP